MLALHIRGGTRCWQRGVDGFTHFEKREGSRVQGSSAKSGENITRQQGTDREDFLNELTGNKIETGPSSGSRSDKLVAGAGPARLMVGRGVSSRFVSDSEASG
jgi:hypothetical protein